MKISRLRPLLVPLIALAVLVAAATTAGAAKKPKYTLLHPGPELTELVKKAQAEGTLNFYTVPPDASVRRVVDAFTKRWNVKATWTRFTTAPLQDRFGAEMGAGTSPADLILISNSPWFGFAKQKGWIAGPKDVGLPGWPKGKVPALYPRQFLTNSASAIVQLQPNVIMYNKNVVSASDAPKTWDDLLDPKWKGKIIMVDPTSSPAYLDLWWAVMKKNGGVSYLEKLRAQATRLYAGATPITQALASGEAAIAVPGVPSIAAQLIASGAPIGTVIPPTTTGPEAVIGLTVGAKHPNAAKLFAYFLLTPQGQALLNADPGSVSIWDLKNMPKGYVHVDGNVSGKLAPQIYKAFGVS
jgi:iron(III) transport system substrate-binding protein